MGDKDPKHLPNDRPYPLSALTLFRSPMFPVGHYQRVSNAKCVPGAGYATTVVNTHAACSRCRRHICRHKSVQLDMNRLPVHMGNCLRKSTPASKRLAKNHACISQYHARYLFRYLMLYHRLNLEGLNTFAEFRSMNGWALHENK